MKRICPRRNRGYSSSIGSLTLRIRSAVAQTSPTGASCAPTLVYSSSRKPLPTPASCSTTTRWPASTSACTPAGVAATRCSPGLISRGTPMTMSALLHGPFLVVAHPPGGEAAADRREAGPTLAQIPHEPVQEDRRARGIELRERAHARVDAYQIALEVRPGTADVDLPLLLHVTVALHHRGNVPLPAVKGHVLGGADERRIVQIHDRGRLEHHRPPGAGQGEAGVDVAALAQALVVDPEPHGVVGDDELAVHLAEVHFAADEVGRLADLLVLEAELHAAVGGAALVGDEEIVAGGVDAVVPVQDEGHHQTRAGLPLAADQRRQPARPHEDVGVQGDGEAGADLLQRQVAQLGGVHEARREDQSRLAGEGGFQAASAARRARRRGRR